MRKCEECVGHGVRQSEVRLLLEEARWIWFTGRDQCWGNFPALRESLHSGEQGNIAGENVQVESRKVWRTRRLRGAIAECVPRLWLTDAAWRFISEVFEEDGRQIKVIDESLA